ncbi:OmpA family protein [Shewanella insulae]|uniref:OmpA/MotB family protein n=1 Tax=Shewanella insulae TaxID=2681496 RepID=UPI001EFD5550|nr:OmpA family protein [Shewanella insulae]MCG9714952.1 OmpA family protein [Shewanella insulae]
MSDNHDLIEDEGAGYLISVSDMMSGLLFIFIITLVAFILNFQDAIQKQKEVTETQKTIVRKLTNTEQVRSELLLNLKEELAKHDIIVEVDTEHGVLRLTEQAVLFETAKDTLDEISTRNLNIIGQVMSSILPCYASLPPEDGFCSDTTQYRGVLDSVFVEGHTDNVPIKSWKYADNWVLSAQRAISAYRQLVPGTQLELLENSSAQPIFSVSGYGEGRPVEGHRYDIPTADPVNRRIDIRFIMTPPSLTAAQQALIKQGVN